MNLSLISRHVDTKIHYKGNHKVEAKLRWWDDHRVSFVSDIQSSSVFTVSRISLYLYVVHPGCLGFS